MPFTLTKEYFRAFMDAAGKGDWAPFVAALDPEVHWVVADPVYNNTSLSGTYNRQEWQEKIGGALFGKLEGGLKMRIDELDIVGNKAIMESSGFATQKNGKPYNNRFCWVIVFSEETGKIVDIREYMNTALVREVMTSN